MVGANTVHEPYVIPISERVLSFRGFSSTFRTVGNAASPQNLFAISNGVASPVLVGIRRLSIQMDATAASTAVASVIKTSRPAALPTVGTVMTKGSFDTSLTSDALVLLRGATASDGGAATAITGTAGTTFWQQLVMRLHTAVGQVLMDDESLIPGLSENDPFVLRADQSLLVQITNATPANNLATNHHILNVAWDEYTLP